VSDRIVLYVGGDAEVERAVGQQQQAIAQEVLARRIVVGGERPGTYHAAQTIELDGLAVFVALTKDS
jgi:cytoskeletal protein CcmA (bactofilin family)